MTSTLFFDTSALVKRYYAEDGTDRVDELIETDGSLVVISSLSIIETTSAFKRKQNRDEITEQQVDQLLGTFFQEALDDFIIVPFEESSLQFAFDLVLKQDLRTLDSLQLSAAITINQETDECTFVCADSELVSTAERSGLDVVNPVN
jgi:predicted nucleic acid-binding protein